MSVNLYGRFEVKRENKDNKKSKWVQSDLALAASKFVNEYTLRNLTNYGRNNGDYMTKSELNDLDYETKLYFAHQADFDEEKGWSKEYELVKNPYCCEGDIAKLSVEDKKKNFIEIFHNNDNLEQKFWPVVLKYDSLPWKALQWKWGVDEVAEAMASKEKDTVRKAGLEKLAKALKKAGLKTEEQTEAVREAFSNMDFYLGDLVELSSNLLPETNGVAGYFVKLADNASEAESHVRYSADHWIDWESLVGAYMKIYKNDDENAVPYTLDHVQCLIEDDVDAMIKETEESIKRYDEWHTTDTPAMRAVQRGIEALIGSSAELFDKGALERFKKLVASDEDDEADEYDEDPEYRDELEQELFELKLFKTLFYRIREDGYSNSYEDVGSRYIFCIE